MIGRFTKTTCIIRKCHRPVAVRDRCREHWEEYLVKL